MTNPIKDLMTRMDPLLSSDRSGPLAEGVDYMQHPEYLASALADVDLENNDPYKSFGSGPMDYKDASTWLKWFQSQGAPAADVASLSRLVKQASDLRIKGYEALKKASALGEDIITQANDIITQLKA